MLNIEIGEADDILAALDAIQIISNKFIILFKSSGIIRSEFYLLPSK
jgi:hypothetical protein